MRDSHEYWYPTGMEPTDADLAGACPRARSCCWGVVLALQPCNRTPLLRTRVRVGCSGRSPRGNVGAEMPLEALLSYYTQLQGTLVQAGITVPPSATTQLEHKVEEAPMPREGSGSARDDGDADSLMGQAAFSPVPVGRVTPVLTFPRRHACRGAERVPVAPEGTGGAFRGPGWDPFTLTAVSGSGRS